MKDIPKIKRKSFVTLLEVMKNKIEIEDRLERIRLEKAKTK